MHCAIFDINMSEINDYLKLSYKWMPQFLQRTEKLQANQRPEEIQKARRIIYQHYASLNTIWLDCEGDFLRELKTHFLSPFLLIHIVMALSLYERFDLIEPLLDKSNITIEKRKKYKERANIALAGKKYMKE